MQLFMSLILWGSRIFVMDCLESRLLTSLGGKRLMLMMDDLLDLDSSSSALAAGYV